MKYKFNFVYLSTNLVNGKQYVEDHSTNNIHIKDVIEINANLNI